jgi:hypothetical protein
MKDKAYIPMSISARVEIQMAWFDVLHNELFVITKAHSIQSPKAHWFTGFSKPKSTLMKAQRLT